MEKLQELARAVSRDGPRRSQGSSTRGRDVTSSGKDTAEGKRLLLTFKSSSFVQNADDSGFGELCPTEGDDPDLWHMRRQYNTASAGQSQSTCSTPVRENTTDQSYSNLDNFCGDLLSISPVPLQESVQNSQNSTAGQRVYQNRRLSDTGFLSVLRPGASFPVLEATNHHHQQQLKREDYSKPSSSLSIGHSTIASMLNALPLNVVRRCSDTSKESGTSTGRHGRSPDSRVSQAPTGNDTAILSESHCIHQSGQSFSKSLVPPQNKTDRNLLKFSPTAYKPVESGLSTRLQTAVDENNNLQFQQEEYSEISDKPGNEENSSSETSSCDEFPNHFEDLADRKGEAVAGSKPQGSTVNVKNDCTTSSRQRARRKPLNPRRSPVKEDPRFKGVTIWLQTSLKNGRSRLDISAIYSNVKVGVTRKKSPSDGSRCSTPKCYCSSDLEGSSPPYVARDIHSTVKTCASCRTRRTPLWRDAEDGTPLCNACGIRYKKYRLRCSKCWHIPKKEVKTYPNCPLCDASLRFSFHKKIW